MWVSYSSTINLQVQMQKKRVWRAMGHVVAAPVDMLMQPGQHRTPWTISWKFRSQAHQQRAIVDCPRKALEMTSVIHFQQGQCIRHVSFLKPVPLVSAPVHGEAEYLVCNNDFLISPPLLLDLGVDVEQLI